MIAERFLYLSTIVMAERFLYLFHHDAVMVERVSYLSTKVWLRFTSTVAWARRTVVQLDLQVLPHEQGPEGLASPSSSHGGIRTHVRANVVSRR